MLIHPIYAFHSNSDPTSVRLKSGVKRDILEVRFYDDHDVLDFFLESEGKMRGYSLESRFFNRNLTFPKLEKDELQTLSQGLGISMKNLEEISDFIKLLERSNLTYRTSKIQALKN